MPYGGFPVLDEMDRGLGYGCAEGNGGGGWGGSGEMHFLLERLPFTCGGGGGGGAQYTVGTASKTLPVPRTFCGCHLFSTNPAHFRFFCVCVTFFLCDAQALFSMEHNSIADEIAIAHPAWNGEISSTKPSTHAPSSTYSAGQLLGHPTGWGCSC